MKKTFAPELLRICYIAETKGEAEAIDLMVEYLLQYGDELLLKTPENMLFIARPAVAKANEILAQREQAETAEEVETVETEETVETTEEPAVETVETETVVTIDANTVIAGLTAGHGLGALQAMITAHYFIIEKDYIQFKFKGCKKANTLVVRYDAGADLYNMEFIKTGTRQFLPYADTVKEIKGLYTWDLKRTFESFTGLYTTL